MSVSTSNTYMKLQNFRKLGKNAKLSKERTLQISGQNLFTQWCPLIRDYTVLHYYETFKNLNQLTCCYPSGFIYFACFQCVFVYIIYRPSGAGGSEGASAASEFFVDVPFLLVSLLNVFFLTEVTKNLLENQQAKSRAS